MQHRAVMKHRYQVFSKEFSDLIRIQESEFRQKEFFKQHLHMKRRLRLGRKVLAVSLMTGIDSIRCRQMGCT